MAADLAFTTTAGTLRRAALSAGGLLFALLGDWLSRSAQSDWAVPAFLVGIVLFAVGNAAKVSPPGSSASSVPRARARWMAVAGGMVLAAGLTGFSLWRLIGDLKSSLGLNAWLAALVALGVTCVAAGKVGMWPARWAGDRTSSVSAVTTRALFAVALMVLVVAGVARFAGLDKVPLGLNPDEGDRAGLAIAFARGMDSRSVFDSGWYYISSVYFTLMSWYFRAFGIGLVQARSFTAIFSLEAVAVALILVWRNFGARAGVLAAGLFAAMGVALQFARETSEAGPTAALWVLSAALFLEAARSGRLAAWIGAGASGAFSIYFYPTGRLWALLAAGYCLYLLAHGLGVSRWRIARGAALAAVAAVVVVLPFFANIYQRPEEFVQRAAQTSLFANENFRRLPYYNPEWSTLRLAQEQVVRTLGILGRFDDRNGFWPTDQPLMPGALAAIVMLGAGWCLLRWRDPRSVLLGMWFVIGMSGSIVTVETPNLQRMATAIPTLAIFGGLVIDALAHHFSALAGRAGARWAAPAATVVSLAVVATLMTGELRFYFNVYGPTQRYSEPTAEAISVRDQGSDTLTMTVGRYFFFVNSGWIRLMAPDTPRGGVRAPGSDLPWRSNPNLGQAFIIYPRQKFYLPYLKEIYPGGSTRDFLDANGNARVTAYRIEAPQLRAIEGATMRAVDGSVTRTSALGEAAPGTAATSWSAGLFVPRHWSYLLRLQGGPARLSIDGTEVLRSSGGTTPASATVTLVRGTHAVVLASEDPAASARPVFEMAPVTPGAPAWAAPAASDLRADVVAPHGLLAEAALADGKRMARLEPALASCCVRGQMGVGGEPLVMTYTGLLNAPVAGAYEFQLNHTGAITLSLDANVIMRADGEHVEDGSTKARVQLTAGEHAVKLVYAVQDSGVLEWVWTPPGGTPSIVPPSALRPPPEASLVALGTQPDLMPFDRQIPVLPLDVTP